MTTILVVDDDVEMRSTLQRELEERGYGVRTAGSVREALAELEVLAIDVLLTDLRMSDRDGIDLLEQTRRAGRRVRPILMSAYATVRDHDAATRLGAVRVLCKPFTSEELEEAVRQAIDCETGFRGTVHGLSLVDLLQMFHFAQRTLRIELSGSVPGCIHLEQGEVAHAATDASSGEPALALLLAADAGSIRTLPAGEHPRTITRPFQSLLLDLLRQLDEGACPPTTAGGGEAAWEELFEPAEEPVPPPAEPPYEVLADEVRRLAPDCGLTLVEGDLLTPLCGDAPAAASECAGVVAALARSAAGVAHDWDRLEHVGRDAGLAILRTDAPGALLLLHQALAGRYAAMKFRAYAARVAMLLEQVQTNRKGLKWERSTMPVKQP